MSLVSIIIPCRNDGKFLPEAIISAQAQTHYPIEIIVVNDHSDDPKTCSVMRELAANGIVVLESEGHGVSAARNTGISHSHGAYILALDADDTIYPTYIEKTTSILDNRPEVGICYCQAELFGLKRGLWKLPTYSFEEMLLGNMIFSAALFRRTDWEAVGGYNEKLLLGLEDHAFWISLLAKGVQVHQLNEVLFRYRIKPHSRTAGLAANDRLDKAVMALFDTHRELYARHADVLFREVNRLRKKNARQGCSFLYRFLNSLIEFELATRHIIKQLIGR